MLTYSLVFIVGLIFGSFSNVLALRTFAHESVVFPNSRCPQCGHELKFYENIPLLSFILLKGKCSDCKRQISYLYPIGELFCAGLFALIYWKFGLNPGSAVMFLVAILTIPYVYIDVKVFRLPNLFTYLLLGGEILYVISRLLLDNSRDSLGRELAVSGLIGLFLLAIYLVTGGLGIGMGDIKLAPLLAFLASTIHVRNAASFFIYTFYSAVFILNYYVS